MTYPRNHMLFQWFWNMPGKTAELGVGSMRFDDPGRRVGDFGIPQVDTDDVMDEVGGKLRTFWTAPHSYIPAGMILQGWKWNQIGRDGKYVSDTTRYHDFGSNGVPGNSPVGAIYPNQVTWVSSWLTDVNRGLAARGRTYWPTNAPLDQFARTTDTATAEMIASLKTLMESWGNWTGIDITGYAPCVMSPLQEGKSRYIRHIGLGHVLDTQRRRRSSQLELPVLSPVADPNPN
jgi:hypothetical protein